MADFESLIQKAESLIARLEAVLPPVATDIDWNALAWRWQVKQGRGYLRAVDHPHHSVLDAICNVNEQKSEIVRNTAQFVNPMGYTTQTATIYPNQIVITTPNGYTQSVVGNPGYTVPPSPPTPSSPRVLQ